MSAWTVIAHTEVSAATQASITFSSIPATYTDLCLVVSARGDRAQKVDAIDIQFNGVTTNRSSRVLQGDGSGKTSFASGTEIFVDAIVGSTSTASTFGNAVFYIPNYTSSTAKSISIDGVSENNGTEAYQTIVAGLWNSTNAITSILIDCLSGSNFVQYTSATLYGITKGSSGGVTVS